MFARMMRDDFGARDPRSWAVNITAHTSGMSLTAQQPVNNVVRGTIQAMALAMAGVQAMEVSAFDEAFRTPSRAAHEVGLRTQQIVQLESGAGRVADPLGGSWYVESLTDEMERRIDAMVRDIEARGTPSDLADGGFFRGIFANAMERHSRQIAEGTLPKVGVNCFTVPAEDDVLLRDVVESKFDPDHERIAEIKAWKSSREVSTLQSGLDELRSAADDRNCNVTPHIAAAYEANVTMGEMAGVLRESYGWPADPLASRLHGLR
jgi:methylmalonyl-CoA mutase N-terminal domain/subunit